MYVAKTKALISFAVTAKMICIFVFAYAKCWFSHDAAHLCWVIVHFFILLEWFWLYHSQSLRKCLYSNENALSHCLLDVIDCQENITHCGGQLSDPTGEIHSPDADGNGRYDLNTLCRWTFDFDSNIVGELHLQFTHVDIPDHKPFIGDGNICERCCYDFVEVSV